MILDNLSNARRYFALHPAFKKAFLALSKKNFIASPAGRYELGDDIFALVSDNAARTPRRSKLEAHRKYIDIQYVVSGSDEIGWKALADCKRVREKYDAKRDVAFYADAPAAFVSVAPGSFVLFFPEDAHAPLSGKGNVRKVVVKVPA